MRALVVLTLAVAAVAASFDPHPNGQRIVGGSLTTVEQYPSMAALLFSTGTVGPTQSCGGTLLNTRSILTAAHCTYGHEVSRWQTRLGSTFANSGGTVYQTAVIYNFPNFNTPFFRDNDISIVRPFNIMPYSILVQPASVAGSLYSVGDNEVVWAVGWGAIYEDGPPSEILRHVQVWTVNQAICRNNYAAHGATITDNMLCSGWLGVGGRDQCQMDSGGPLFHNGVVIGVSSWGIGCGRPNLPGVNTRVSRYAAWIQAIA